MNYLGYTGYWFYGASAGVERASLFASYGLLTSAPEPSQPSIVRRVIDWFWEFFS